MFRILRFELDRNICVLSIVLFLIFAFFSLLLIQAGIAKFNSDLKEQQDFLKSEERVVGRFINYHMYATYGFRQFLEPSPTLALFFNSTTLDDLHMFLDSGVRLRLNKNEIGKGLFERPTGGILDFSWFIIVIGGFIYSLWGFFTFRNKEYLKLLENFAGRKIVHFGVIFGRIFIIIFSLAIVLVLEFVMFFINGLQLTLGIISGLLINYLISVVVIVTLVVLSAGFGVMKNWIKGAIYAGSFFFVLVFILPEALNIVFSEVAEAKMKTAYKHEAQKMEKLMLFEKVAYEYTSRFIDIAKRREADKEMLLNWVVKYYPEVEKMESQMIDVTQTLARQFQLWASFSPVTFYKSLNNEISSKGFNSYLEFYKKGQVNQKGFLNYYMEKKSYNPYEKVIPFLPTEELVSKSKPSLPYYFLIGIFVSLLYIFGALLFTLYREKKFLFPKIQVKTENLDIDLKSGEDVHIMIDKESGDLFSNVLNGEIDQIDGKITIDGKSIVTKDIEDYHYFPDIQKLPGNISVKSITSLSKIYAESDIIRKRLKDIDFESKLRLMLKISKSFKSKIYVFHLSVPGSYYELIRELRDEFKSFISEDSLVIYLCPENAVPLGVLKPNQSKMFMKFHGEFIFKDLYKFDDD